VYVHNEQGTKRLVDNVFFNNRANGIQVYASHKNEEIRNVRVEGNVLFNNGIIAATLPALANLVVNAQVPMHGMAVVGNLLYYSGQDGTNLSVGTYGAENDRDIVVQDNFAVGGRVGLEMPNPWQSAVVTGNTVVGGVYLVDLGGGDMVRHYKWSANTWLALSDTGSWRLDRTRYDWTAWRAATGLGDSDQIQTALPQQPVVFVRRNHYEPGRAHLIIYNWASLPRVSVDVSQVLHRGDRYELHNVQSLFDKPVASGVYDGDSLVVPMTGVNPPEPVDSPERGTRSAPRTGPLFDVFLLTSPHPRM
jgi:hypothetical protein